MNVTFPEKTDDFFPYADQIDACINLFFELLIILSHFFIIILKYTFKNDNNNVKTICIKDWTGYFTSRVAFKYNVKLHGRYL